MPVISDLSPAERATAVADLLAAAVLRVCRPIPTLLPSPENSRESLPNPLADPAGTSVTVHAG